MVFTIYYRQLQISPFLNPPPPPNKNRAWTAFEPHGLCVSAAVLYQLSYEDPT